MPIGAESKRSGLAVEPYASEFLFGGRLKETSRVIPTPGSKIASVSTKRYIVNSIAVPDMQKRLACRYINDIAGTIGAPCNEKIAVWAERGCGNDTFVLHPYQFLPATCVNEAKIFAA